MQQTRQLFYNGIVWPSKKDTIDSSTPLNWFVVTGNIFTAVGRGDVPTALTTTISKQVDLHQAVVLPGLVDSHCHVYLMVQRQ